ncbi:uncharacterized protein LOC121987007 [Zingiber officinale]|uniref:uncharacterized protein LOC121987007 n=1 Tax=Zingiber officinale TaxID=94328 RepID=UPI001C4BA60B|nr:uncharacterized protein LOC121987007 [Zingiber officinale]
MNIVGSFPMAIGQRRILLVVVDYFSKWVEVKPLARISEQMSNGQAEVTNREILRGLQTRLNHVRGSWVDELSSVLWVLHTTPKEATDVTLFQLVYKREVAVPVKIGVESDWVQLYDKRNGEQRLMELDLVDEVQDKVVVWLMAYR